MNIEDGEPRPVEWVSAGGNGVPLSFTTSSLQPPGPAAPVRRRPAWLLALLAAGVLVVLASTLHLTGGGRPDARRVRPTWPSALPAR